jgi:hypothetical protein
MFTTEEINNVDRKIKGIMSDLETVKEYTKRDPVRWIDDHGYVDGGTLALLLAYRDNYAQRLDIAGINKVDEIINYLGIMATLGRDFDITTGEGAVEVVIKATAELLANGN